MKNQYRLISEQYRSGCANTIARLKRVNKVNKEYKIVESHYSFAALLFLLFLKFNKLISRQHELSRRKPFHHYFIMMF